MAAALSVYYSLEAQFDYQMGREANYQGPPEMLRFTTIFCAICCRLLFNSIFKTFIVCNFAQIKVFRIHVKLQPVFHW